MQRKGAHGFHFPADAPSAHSATFVAFSLVDTGTLRSAPCWRSAQGAAQCGVPSLDSKSMPAQRRRCQRRSPIIFIDVHDRARARAQGLTSATVLPELRALSSHVFMPAHHRPIQRHSQPIGADGCRFGPAEERHPKHAPCVSFHLNQADASSAMSVPCRPRDLLGGYPCDVDISIGRCRCPMDSGRSEAGAGVQLPLLSTAGASPATFGDHPD